MKEAQPTTKLTVTNGPTVIIEMKQEVSNVHPIPGTVCTCPNYCPLKYHLPFLPTLGYGGAPNTEVSSNVGVATCIYEDPRFAIDYKDPKFTAAAQPNVLEWKEGWANCVDNAIVEVWNGSKKVSVYPKIVMRIWGETFEQMSEDHKSLTTVQAAFDWLYNKE